MSNDTATVTPLPVRGADLRASCADVVHAMLMGTYGTRVREYARTAVGARFSAGHLDDPPAVVAAVVRLTQQHMHEVHAGLIARKIVLALVDPAHADAEATALDREEG